MTFRSDEHNAAKTSQVRLHLDISCMWIVFRLDFNYTHLYLYSNLHSDSLTNTILCKLCYCSQTPTSNSWFFLHFSSFFISLSSLKAPTFPFVDILERGFGSWCIIIRLKGVSGHLKCRRGPTWPIQTFIRMHLVALRQDPRGEKGKVVYLYRNLFKNFTFFMQIRIHLIKCV